MQKWCLIQKNLNICCDFICLGVLFHCKGDFIQCLKGNHQLKCQPAGDTNCLIRLTAFVKGDTLRDDQSLKPRYMKCEWHLFAIHANQPGMVPTHNSTHFLLKHSRIKMQVPTVATKKFITHFAVIIFKTPSQFSLMKPHSI